MADKSFITAAEDIAGELAEKFESMINDGTHNFNEYRLLYALATDALFRNIRNNAPKS